MKFFLALLSVLLLYTIGYAQETPRSTQYIFNNYLLNPALSGIDSYIDLKLGYRKQWSGIDGAPNTQYLSLSLPLGQEFIRESVNSFSQRGYNPMSRSFVNSYTAAAPHHGLGLIAMTDKAGLVRQTGVSVSYAYHLGLTSDINLSAGFNGGFNSLNIDVKNIKAQDELDPLFAADYNNKIRPDLGLGVWLYSPRFFAGASAKKLIGRRSQVVNNEVRTLPFQATTFYGTAGYKVFIDEDIAMIPSFLATYTANAPIALDGNLKLAYQDKLWIGGSFRNNDSFSMLAGFNVLKLVNLSYSYDVNTSSLKSVNRGTHEIVLGFLLNNFYEVRCSTRQF